MIPVRETKPGQFERITGNPTLKSLDGTRKAPLRTILHESWSAEERAAFGVYLVEPATIPQGKRAISDRRIERINGEVVEVMDLEDIPEPPKITMSDRDAVSLLRDLVRRVDALEKAVGVNND